MAIAISLGGLQSCFIDEGTNYSLDQFTVVEKARTDSLYEVWVDSGYVKADENIIIFDDVGFYQVLPDIFNFYLSGKESHFIEVLQLGGDDVTVYPGDMPLQLGDYAYFTNAPSAPYQHIILYFNKVYYGNKHGDYKVQLEAWIKK